MKLQMKNIHKAFGSNEVLKGVDLTIDSGEICALLGENGAGKSTLMNILGGVLQADQGSVSLDGKVQSFTKPLDAIEAGIAFIHQELNLINDLPIYENMFLGRERKGKLGLLNLTEMRDQTAAVFERMGIALPPETMVRDLDASYKQIVEIARALMMNASLIIMDEPTSSLTETEIERVFAMMQTMKEQGVGIIFISHKLREVMDCCDRYLVLRDGEVAASGAVDTVTTDQLASAMVGHEVRTEALQSGRALGETVLQVTEMTGASFRDINFEIKGGEVVGFTGLLGDGRSELFLALFGAGEAYTGQVYFEGRPIRLKQTAEAMDYGIAYVPRNRKENGIIKDMSIVENASIVGWPRHAKLGVIDRAAQKLGFEGQVARLKIKMGQARDLITSLSGGNQQKVVLAKWLSEKPRVLILDNPTQGVDVGAKEEIYDTILQLAEEGVAVIVLSSEAQEIIRVCDRAFVMYHGDVAGTLTGADMNEQTIMRLATGAGAEA